MSGEEDSDPALAQIEEEQAPLELARDPPELLEALQKALPSTASRVLDALDARQRLEQGVLGNSWWRSRSSKDELLIDPVALQVGTFCVRRSKD